MISTIINNSVYQSEKEYWLSRCQESEGPESFSTMLWPVFNYFCQHIPEQYQHIFIQTYIKKIAPILARACCVEMHSVRDRGFLKSKSSELRFQEYIQLLQVPSNAADLLKKYPLMDQYLMTVTQQYFDFCSEWLQRYEKDHQEICELFFDDDQSYQLTHFESGGDTHKKGRTVIILTLKNNAGEEKKIVYKPRSVQAALAVNDCLKWINDHTYFDHKIVRYLDKKTYAWCEFIKHKSCNTLSDIKLFYERFGSLLALFYVLNGHDIHIENAIACGAFPVVIDLECVFKPAMDLSKLMVSDVGILPGDTFEHDGVAMDLSALLGEGGQRSIYTGIGWEQSGTDQMCSRRKAYHIRPGQNLPKLMGEKINPLAYEHEFTEGFRATYQLFIQEKSEFVQSKLLSNFKNATIRILIRNTSDYAKLLFESYHPELWFYQAKRDHHFAWLTRCSADNKVRRQTVDFEIADLITGNIPAFYCQADGHDIFDGQDNVMPIEVSQPGFDAAVKHIHENVTEADQNTQIQLIHLSFKAAKLNQKHSIEQATQQLLDRILEHKVTDEFGCYWYNVEQSEAGRWKVKKTDLDLYNGLPGIALTYAYAAKLFNRPRYYEVTYEIINTIITLLGHEFTNQQRDIGVGAFSGFSGIVYTFAKIKKLGFDIDVDEITDKLLDKIPLLISKDNQFDIIGGAAGCMAALGAVKNDLEVGKVNEILLKATQHLLSHFPRENTALLGFSHGVTGMAWALEHFAPAECSAEVSEFIAWAEAHEQHHYSREQRNWRDLRGHPQETYAMYWCHGAPGMVLAKLTDQQSIHESVSNIVEKGLDLAPNLCHGAAGNLEVLRCYAERFDDKAIAERVRAKTIQLVNSTCQEDYQAAGLMTGQAGLAYYFMRTLNPELVPNILLLR